MSKVNGSHTKEFTEWLNESMLRIEDIKNTIDISEKIKQSNIKQLKLRIQSTNLVIKQYNVWAEKNKVQKINLL